MIGCATCGAAAVGTYNDGSPRFPRSCDHPALVSDEASTTVDPYGRVIVELDPFEYVEGQACGERRYKSAVKRKRADHFGEPSLDSHVLGGLGERVFAKWLGEPWECTTGRFGGLPDIRGCQVRTVSAAKLELKIRDNDPPRTPVVSIVSNGTPRFWIRGWILARDGRRIGKPGDPGNRGAPAFFVRSMDLRPMAEFLASDPVRAALGLAPMAAAT